MRPWGSTRPALSALALVVLATLGSEAGAQSTPTLGERFRVRAWGAEDGLPQASATAIEQTRDGYLWVGTFGGLARFDGVRFEVFDVASPGLPIQRILSLHEDRAGDLWIGGQLGLARRRGGEFEAIPLPGTPEVWDIAEDPDGRIWLATSQGLRVQDGAGFREVDVPGAPPDAKYLTLWIDPRGVVWAGGSPSLLVRIEGDDQRLLPAPEEARIVWSIAGDDQGALWMSGDGGRLYRVEEGGFREVGGPLPSADQTDPLLVDSDGRLWLGAADAWFVDPAADGAPRLVPATVARSGVRSLFEDREGHLWVGTNLEGLLRVDRSPVLEPRDLPDKQVAGLDADPDGDVFAAFLGQGVWKIAPGVAAPVALAVGSEEITGPLIFTGAGTLWVGVGERLAYRRPGGGEGEVALGDLGLAFSFLEDAPGGLWVGCALGLGYWDDERGSLERVPGVPRVTIHALAEMPDESLWIATDYGLLRRDPTGAIASFSVRDGLPRGQIRSLLVMPDGSLWIGAYGGGLARYAEGRFHLSTAEDGLQENVASSLLYRPEDDDQPGVGGLWINGNRGVSRLSQADLRRHALQVDEPLRVRVFPTGEGTGGFSPSSAVASDGTLWFATIHGPRGLEPRVAVASGKPPPVVIEGVFQGGRRLPWSGGAVELPPTAPRTLEVRYTGFDFTMPESLRFSYRLVGRDEGWVEAGGRRSAYYSHLEPGAYSFQLRAHSGGSYTGDPAQLAIVIRPHPWERTGLQVGGVLSLLFLVGWAVAARLRSAERRNRALRREMETRQQMQSELLASRAVLAESRRLEAIGRLTGGIAHDFNNLLTVMTGVCQFLDDDFDDKQRLTEDVDQLRRCVDRATNLTRQLLTFGRGQTLTPKIVHLDRFLSDFVAMLERVLRDDIRVRQDLHPAGPVLVDPGQLEQVVMNLTLNARDAMPRGGTLTFSTGVVSLVAGDFDDGSPLEPGTYARLVVQDTGEGIDPEVQKHIFEPFFTTKPQGAGSGFGLSMAYGFILQSGGAIRVESEPGQGARFEILLPLHDVLGGPPRRAEEADR